MKGNIVFAKAYDQQKHKETEVPRKFLQELLARQRMSPAAIAATPQNGLLDFLDGAYLLSTRPILTSQRTGKSRGVLIAARKFDDNSVSRVTDMTRTSVNFQRVDDPALLPDYQQALDSLRQGNHEVEVLALAEDSVAGYTLVPDIFDSPLLILKVDTRRLIYARGKLSQRYLFATLFCGALLASAAIIAFLHKFVLSRLGRLAGEVGEMNT